MFSTLFIVLALVLNLIPADVASFTITTPDKQVIQYDKQPNGGWKEIQKTDQETLN